MTGRPSSWSKSNSDKCASGSEVCWGQCIKYQKLTNTLRMTRKSEFWLAVVVVEWVCGGLLSALSQFLNFFSYFFLDFFTRKPGGWVSGSRFSHLSPQIFIDFFFQLFFLDFWTRKPSGWVSGRRFAERIVTISQESRHRVSPISTPKPSGKGDLARYRGTCRALT